ncbi:Non-specific lipid-transfer protein 8 [Striga hermonthica]|uniref:Non-specific lipid-transfer protein n=1 Tax=Striga hermonthica TaxID=68872 RepID=A0A9N7R8X2_STRHE|nr:Non-specific lipid-transfer protein 8 [Striga hermonthica]
MNRLLYGLLLASLLMKAALSVPSCTQVLNDLAPCLSFLQGKIDQPTAQCCGGIKALKAIVKTKEDRVAACNCGKQALSMVDYDPKRLPLIPKPCGVDFNLPPIDKNFDCSKVSELDV